MTKWEKAMDRLAMEICWSGFCDPKRVGCSKRQYWATVTDNAKQSYFASAYEFLHMHKRLGRLNVQKLIDACEAAEKGRAA